MLHHKKKVHNLGKDVRLTWSIVDTKTIITEYAVKFTPAT